MRGINGMAAALALTLTGCGPCGSEDADPNDPLANEVNDLNPIEETTLDDGNTDGTDEALDYVTRGRLVHDVFTDLDIINMTCGVDPNPCIDMEDTHTYCDAVISAINSGVLKLITAEGDCMPDRLVARSYGAKSTILSILGPLDPFEYADVQTFTDVPPEVWYHAYVEAMSQFSIIEGDVVRGGMYYPEDMLDGKALDTWIGNF